MGNGLAGRFTLALSKAMDSTAADVADIETSPVNNNDLKTLLEEINASDNLTVKLSSISKIVSSFNKKSGASSLAKKKLEETLS